MVVCMALVVTVVVGAEPPVTKHEQADDTRDGLPWHLDTQGGSLVVAVFRVVV